MSKHLSLEALKALKSVEHLYQNVSDEPLSLKQAISVEYDLLRNDLEADLETNERLRNLLIILFETSHLSN